MAKKQASTEKFKVYHINIDKLEKLRRSKECEEILDDEQLDAVNNWEQLRTSVSAKKRQRLEREKKIKQPPVAYSKSKNALALMDMGYYDEVADVEWKEFDLDMVVKLTTSINTRWCLTTNRNVSPTTNIDQRDTHQWDLIEHQDTFFLVMPLGYVDTSEGDWLS